MRSLILLSLLSSIQIHSHSDCLPESELRFPLTFQKGVDASIEMRVEQQIHHFTEVMAPEVKRLTGKELKVELDWGNPRVNASATRDEKNNPVLIILGGMARHPQLTYDGFYGILCHELGHYLGGAPKKKRGRSDKLSWSSAEGQADYYATSKCLPLIFKNPLKSINPNDVAEKKEVDLAFELCRGESSCVRMGLAGLSMARVFASLKNYYDLPSLEVQDHFNAWETELGHPQPQCRLDTLKAGILCSVSPRDPFDNLDPSVGACYSYKDEGGVGERPRCWYRPLSHP